MQPEMLDRSEQARPGCIAAAIIDADQFPLHGAAGQSLVHPLHQGIDVFLLVVQGMMIDKVCGLFTARSGWQDDGVLLLKRRTV